MAHDVSHHVPSVATAQIDPQVRLERVSDTVFIEGLVLHTVIGIDADERHQPQPVVVDLELGVDHLDAGQTNRIADALDYSAVRRRLIELAASHRVQLLEAFAELIAEMALREFGATRAKVRVAKPRKCADVNAFGVVIERRRVGAIRCRTPDLCSIAQSESAFLTQCPVRVPYS